MQGKTHVVFSLAGFHALFISHIGYTVYASRTSSDAAGNDLISVPFGSTVSLYAYLIGVLMTVLIVLTVFQMSRGFHKRLLAYLGLLFILGVGFAVTSDGAYMAALVASTAMFMIGTLLPDIDSPSSVLGRFIKPISSRIPHRTITHTIWAVMLLLAAAFFLRSFYLFMLTAGYVLHIAEDSFSKQGISWFYPLSSGYITYDSGRVVKRGRRPGLLSYRVGGSGESLIFKGSIALHIVCVALVLWFQVS